MTQEEYEHIKRRIRERAWLEKFHINCEVEKFKMFGLCLNLPLSPLDSAVMDYVAYGTDISKENVLRLLRI